jgi:cyclopropane-fatty-acyl-phospholipid synthase
MMLLKPVLAKFVKTGTLHVTDATGDKYTFSGSPGPEVAIHIHNKKTELRLLLNADIALGEAYMNQDLTIEQGSLSDFLDLCLRNYALSDLGWLNRLNEFVMRPFRYWYQYNPLGLAKNHIAHHYDLSGELYKLFLDSDFQYSCAYFEDENQSLETAQENKKRHLAAKLRLEPGMKVLDIGSGWGGLALYLAKHADVEVTGVTLSEEQVKIANDRAKAMGLSDRVRFYLRDYREEKNRYDRIVSVGMFEHVGVPHYQSFFNDIHNLLTDKGLAVLHAIGRSGPPEYKRGWSNKYIFPGGYCPALSEVLKRIEKSKLFVTDVEILRYHYAYTLQHWHDRFQASRDQARSLYDERFCRMWEFYLKESEMSFRHLGYMVFQIQLVRDPAIATLTRDYINQWEKNV